MRATDGVNYAWDMALTDDTPQKVVLVGRGAEAAHDVDHAAIARLTGSGDPDPSLDGDGVRTDPGLAELRRVALDPDGSMAAVGETENGHYGVVRLTAAGDRDPARSQLGLRSLRP